MKIVSKLVMLLFCLSTILLAYQSQASSPVKPEVSSPVKQETSKEKWEYYASDEEDTGYFYRPDALQRLKGDHVRVWVRAFYSEKNQKYSDAKFHWEIDCAKKRLRGISATAKKRDGTSAVVTESSDWSPIPAESTAETLYETVCKKKDKKTP